MTITRIFITTLLLSGGLLSAQEELLGQPLLPSDTGTVFRVCHEMPMFSDCEGETDGSYMEIKQCADMKMLDFIYDLQQYPEKAIADGSEGMAIVSFIVERDGRITSIKTVRGVSPEIDEEALYIVETMALESHPWRPGYHDGEAVRTQFNLPIKFRLPR